MLKRSILEHVRQDVRWEKTRDRQRAGRDPTTRNTQPSLSTLQDSLLCGRMHETHAPPRVGRDQARVPQAIRLPCSVLGAAARTTGWQPAQALVLGLAATRMEFARGCRGGEGLARPQEAPVAPPVERAREVASSHGNALPYEHGVPWGMMICVKLPPSSSETGGLHPASTSTSTHQLAASALAGLAASNGAHATGRPPRGRRY